MISPMISPMVDKFVHGQERNRVINKDRSRRNISSADWV
jgi:hypothetical protein